MESNSLPVIPQNGFPFRERIDGGLLQATLSDILGFAVLEVDAEKSHEFRLNASLGAAWRSSDSAAYEMVYRRSAFRRLLRKPRMWQHFRQSSPTGVGLRPSDATEGTVIYPRDNTQVVVAKSAGVVCKMARPDSTPLPALETEAIAAQLVPEYAPRVKGRSKLEGQYDYIITDFVDDVYPVADTEWPSVFGQCLKIVELAAERNKPTTMLLEECTGEWDRLALAPDSGSAFSRSSLDLVDKMKNRLLRDRNQPIGHAFAHGDLTRPNVARPSQDELRLFDWGNGGHRPLLFDVTVHEFYLHRPQFWSKLRTAKTEDVFSEAGHGYVLQHARALFELADLPVNVQTLREHMIASLYVLVASNRIRYVGRDEIEGARFFEYLSRTVDMVLEG